MAASVSAPLLDTSNLVAPHTEEGPLCVAVAIVRNTFNDAQATILTLSLQQRITKGVSPFRKKYGTHKITLLMSLVINGHFGAMRTLLKQPALHLINASDTRGMTALHYAALVNRGDMIDLLLESGAGAELKNVWNGTYSDITALCYPPIPAANEWGFSEITLPYMPPEQFVAQWRQPAPEELGIDRIGRKMLETYLTTPPHLTYEKGGRFPKEVGVVTIADEKIAPETVVGIYSGVIGEPNHSSAHQLLMKVSETSFAAIDGAEIGSPITRCADGFPTATTMWVRSARSAARLFVLIAAETIPAGAPITFNYGKQSLTQHSPDYVELKPAELREWLSRFNYKALIKRKHNPRRSFKRFLIDNLSLQRLTWIMNTPLVLLKLLAEGLINADFIKFLLTHVGDQFENSSKMIAIGLLPIGMLLYRKKVNSEGTQQVYRTLFEVMGGELDTKKLDALAQLFSSSSEQVEVAMENGCPSYAKAICILLEMCSKEVNKERK